MKLRVIFLILFVSSIFVYSESVLELSNNGIELKKYYDSFDISNLWIMGQRIDWESGKSLGTSNNKKATHCSAFVAAALKNKGIYILRPPEHKTKDLANSQFDWLNTKEAIDLGWTKIDGENRYKLVQNLANQGYFIVAVFRNKDDKKPGHIALIYPGILSDDELINNGPLLIQAGHINGKGITLRKGFEKHIEDWNTNNIEFYGYKIK